VLDCGKYTTVLPSDSPIGSPVRGLRGTLNLEQVDKALGDPESPAEELNGLLSPSHFSYKIHNYPERLIVQWPSEWGSNFLKATVKAAHALRVERRDPSFSDYIVSVVGSYMSTVLTNPIRLFTVPTTSSTKVKIPSHWRKPASWDRSASVGTPKPMSV
jgi:hypothetical protein